MLAHCQIFEQNFILCHRVQSLASSHILSIDLPKSFLLIYIKYSTLHLLHRALHYHQDFRVRLHHFPTDLVIIMEVYLDFCWIFGGKAFGVRSWSWFCSSNSIMASSWPPKELEVLHCNIREFRWWFSDDEDGPINPDPELFGPNWLISDNWVADSCPNDRWSSTLTTSDVSWPARASLAAATADWSMAADEKVKPFK